MKKHGLRQKVWRRSKVFLTVLGLVGICTSAMPVGAQTPPRTGEKVWEYLANLPKEQRLAVLEREAKREGSVVVYGALGIDRANIHFVTFRKKYPDIKVDFTRMRTPELVDRVLLEHRTKRVHGGMAITVVPWLELLKDALAPYEPTTWEDFYPEFRRGGRGQGWTAVLFEAYFRTIAWRTDRISRDEAPKTLDEVADPKWKGLVGRTTHLETAIDLLIRIYGEELAMKKLRKLAALENRLYRSHAALSQALAAGEIDIAWELSAHRPIQLKTAGAPVDWVPQDPLTGQAGTISLIRGTEHPYAAALLMESVTTAESLEYSDKHEGGRIFGNRKGTFTFSLSDLPKITFTRPIAEDQAREFNRLGEQLFIRR